MVKGRAPPNGRDSRQWGPAMPDSHPIGAGIEQPGQVPITEPAATVSTMEFFALIPPKAVR